MSAFVPDPSWPSIVELATELWGNPTDRRPDEVRFGSRGSKRVKQSKNIWKDEESGEGGGYIDLYRMARGELPPRTDGNSNGRYNGVPPWGDIRETYDYPGTDADPRLIQVVRTKSGKPRFRQRQPIGDGKWKWHVDDIPDHNRRLYRLAELRAAPRDEIVWICAGEKDAKRLYEAGLTTTTNIGGEGKWRGEYNEELRDRPCIVLQDNDDTGAKHVAMVARAIHGIAASVRVLLLPNLPDKGDVSNWLDAGNSLNELHRLAREAPEYQLPPTEPIASGFLLDPWADPPQPEWPAGILAPAFERTVAEIALADGVDMGAQAMAVLAAASGAADKQSRLDVYLNGRFLVPPILWVMIVAESGMRKSAMLSTAFTPIKRATGKQWADYRLARKNYDALAAEDRRDAEEPVEPSSLFVDDITPEKLAELLGNNPRGLLMLKEELVGMFDFGRYSNTSGAAARGFLLSAFDGGDTWFHRRSGSTQITNAALAVFGCTQPARLAKFKDLEDDGMLQRNLVARPMRVGGGSRPDVHVHGLDRLEAAITGLIYRDAMQYRLSPVGAAMVRETERLGAEWEKQAEAGQGFPAWARKMHGQHARLALVLHLMEAPAEAVIADDVVMRAGRLIREYLLPHAYGFYSGLLDGGLEVLRSTAGWLLTKAPDRFTAGNVQQGVAACQRKPLKFIQQALDPLMTGGWLEPETQYPNNRAWTINPGVREYFAERTKAERERRAALLALIRGGR